MPRLGTAQQFAQDAMNSTSSEALADTLYSACDYMQCRYFALSHHIDFLASPDLGLRLHNYPEEWAHWFDDRQLGPSDPVHRASQRSAVGFLWRDIEKIVILGADDEYILSRAKAHGIGDGMTIPAHVPGEAHGSVSFAWSSGETVPADILAFAQIVGSFAFEAARRIRPGLPTERHPELTKRQRECVLWVARGKTDWEIARILGVSHVTVIEHLRNARQRYGATTRATLTVRALFDGAFSFADIIRH